MEKKTFETLREEYSFFSFDEIQIRESDNIFHVSYIYALHKKNGEKTEFTHSLVFPNRNERNKKKDKDNLSASIFYLGVAEIVNYWKIACPKIIKINTGFLDEYQQKWFKNLFYNGLGEFMYVNTIIVSEEEFFEFQFLPEITETALAPLSPLSLSENILLPIGGGKDSIVSYELLQNISPDNTTLFAVNAIEATKRLFKKAEKKSGMSPLNIQRILDKKIGEYNANGFLNGHVPFSALLGFVAVLTSLLQNKKYILLSNESSANEENVVFEGVKVNHQFSKSIAFENDFRTFIQKYIHPNIEYLSMLRPLSEIQIGKIFAHSPDNFPIFKSCNAGSKKDVWCNACPKCLFAYIILFPFVKKENMIKIFGHDLFENRDMKEMFHDLVDSSRVKPFECVGTYSEINLALQMSVYQYDTENIESFPVLLQEYVQTYWNNSLTNIAPLEILENTQELREIDENNNNLMCMKNGLGEKIIENMKKAL